MGDACNMNDLERFMRSPEGKAHLERIRKCTISRRVIGVEFSNDIDTIGIELNFDDGTTFACRRPEMDIDALREEFTEVLEREYYVDFPERKK